MVGYEIFARLGHMYINEDANKTVRVGPCLQITPGRGQRKKQTPSQEKCLKCIVEHLQGTHKSIKFWQVVYIRGSGHDIEAEVDFALLTPLQLREQISVLLKHDVFGNIFTHIAILTREWLVIHTFYFIF